MDALTTTKEIIKPPKLKPKQLDFIHNYYVDKETRGNVYQSAIKAGFRPSYARVMTVNARKLQWMEDARKYMTQMDIGLIKYSLEQEALNAASSRDRIQALSILGKWNGLDTSQKTEVNLTFTNSVPRPNIESAQSIKHTKTNLSNP